MPRAQIQPARPPRRAVLAELAKTADRSGATSDAHLVELWLAGKRSAHTQRAYAADVAGLLGHLEGRRRCLPNATVDDVQSWARGLQGATSSRARRIAAARSLLTFGQRTGYLPFNVGRVLERVQVPNVLAERILSEDEVRAMLGAAEGRDRLLLRCLYLTGARIGEACGLRWAHVHELAGGQGVLTIHGKGGKTRHVLIPADLAADLKAAKPEGTPDDAPVFATRKGRPVHPHNVAKTVRAIAKRAGITRPISPHWLRHAHASHALDHGAPVHLVQATLGHASVATTGRYLHTRPGDGSSRYLFCGHGAR